MVVSNKESSKTAWFQQYYSIKALDITWQKGTGRRKKEVFDELYTCKVDPKKCKFNRKVSKLYSSTSRLSDHLELKYQISKDKKVKNSSSPMILMTQIDNRAIDKVLDFETSLVDQIVADCQAFTITKSSQFQTMLKAVGCD